MNTNRSAYKIEDIKNDGFKTCLCVRDINSNEEMSIGLNNADPIPYNIDTGKGVNVLCKVKAEKASSFLSEYRLFPPAGETSFAGDVIYCNEVFPLAKDDILIIESSTANKSDREE